MARTNPPLPARVRRGSRLVRALVLPLLLAMLAPSCVSLGARAYVGAMYAKAEGSLSQQSLTLASGGSMGTGTGADIQDDLGADDGSFSGWAKVILEPLDFGRVTASVFQYDDSGVGTLAGDFGDLSAGTAVRSTVAFDQAKLSYTADLIDLGVFRIGPGIGVDVFDIDTTVAPTSGSAAAELDTTAVMPMLYVQASVDAVIAALEVDAGWMDADLGDFDGRVIDVEANLFFNIFPFVELMAGYRYIDIDGRGREDGRSFETDFVLDGWFVGGGVSF